MIWDVFNIIVVLICMFYLPIVIVFDYSYSHLVPTHLIRVLPFVLIMDILINMNTGYFEKGQVVRNRLQIIVFYWKKNNFTGIFSVIHFIISLFFDPGFGSEEAEHE